MRINRRGILALVAVLCACGSVTAAEVPAGEVPTGGVILTAELTVKAGQEKAVEAALLEMVAPTRKEKGCLCYNLHRSKKDPLVFMFYEQWASRAALDAHMKTPHMKTMQEKTKGLIEKGNVTFYDLVR